MTLPAQNCNTVLHLTTLSSMESTMRRTLIIIGCLSLALLLTNASSAQIRNSRHDLSSTSTTAGPKSTNVNDVCVFCHTPHSNQATTLLWNRTASTATYKPYSSATMEQIVPQPGGASKNCLSCHDGTVAFNSIYNGPGSGSGTVPTFAGTGKIDTTGFGGMGTNLSNDHPVSIVYSTSQATDAHLRAPSLVNNHPSVSYGGVTLPLFGTSTADATVECTSCHDPHDNSNGTFLRVANTGSQMCFTCHNK